jgi:HEAT repeat protein
MLKRAILLLACLSLPFTPAWAKDSSTAGKILKEARPIPAVPPRRDVAIDEKLQSEARAELDRAIESPDPVIRGHAVEAMQQLFGAKARQDIGHALRDSEPFVRFAAAMAIGDAKIVSLKDEVLKLVDDNDPNVRIAVRYALHRLGDYRFSHDLEKTARDPDPGVRGNTAIALGRIEDASAVKVLAPMLKDANPGVRLQVAEALWRHGDEHGFEALVAATVSAYPDDVIVAMLALSATRNQKLMGHVDSGLNSDFPEIALASARAVGELGSDAGYGVALEGARSRDPRQRYMAAVAFGTIGRADAQEALGTLLRDKDSPDVRLAAAFSLLQLGGK